MDMLQRFGRVAFITAFAVSFCAAQWVQTASSPKGSGITDLVVKQSNGYLFATTGSFNWPNADTGGVHRSTDGGDTWTRVFPAYIARMIALKQDSILFASVWPTPAQTEGLYYSTNNGNTWTLTWNAGPGNNVFAVAFDSATQYAYAGSRLGIARNTFGGTTGGWSVISNLPLGSWVRDIALDHRFANMNYVYVAAQNPSNPSANGVYYSTNQGSVFTRIPGIPLGDTVTSLIVVRDTTITASGVTDIEALYTGRSNGKMDRAILVGTLVFNLVHFITGDPEVATWYAFYVGIKDYIYAGAFDDGFGGGGVLHSTDRGANWAGIDEGLPLERKISAIAGFYAGTATAQLYAGMHLGQNALSPVGAPVYRRTITITDVKEGSNELPWDFALLQNYPNPFNPKTEIVYRVPSREFIELRVFDVLGREVATLVNEVKPPGEYSVTLDARLPYSNSRGGQGSHLSSGVYFYRLSTTTFVQTKKLVLLR